jgi:hypothetical protein
MKRSFFMMVFVLASAYTALQAQEYRTDIGIRKQIVDNRQPNAAYAPEIETSRHKNKGFAGSSLARAIKDGKISMPVTTAPVGPVTTAQPARPFVVLPSEVGAGQARAEAETGKPSTGRVALPSQEGEPSKQKAKAGENKNDSGNPF